MRILQIINHFFDGGAATVVVETCLEMQRVGHDVEVLAIYGIGPMATPLQEANIPIHDLGIAPDVVENANFRKYSWRVLPSLRRLVRDGVYDIVHVHLFPASYYTVAALLGVPNISLVFTEHNEHNRRRDKRWMLPLENFVYARFDAVIGVGPTATRNLVSWLPRVEPRVHTINNAIDTAKFQSTPPQRQAYRVNLGVDEDMILVMFVGRLIPIKNPNLLLDVVTDVLAHTDQKICIKIVGIGPLQELLQERIRTDQLEEYVELLGFRNDIPQLLIAADILVLPSRWEGLPMVVLEAMAARCTVIATDVGAMSSVITPDENGILIRSESQSSLATAFQRAIKDAPMRERLGQRAQQVVMEKFSIRSYVINVLSVYEAVLN